MITVDRHIHDGGTFVTNFGKGMLPVYQEAIRVYNELGQKYCGDVKYPKRNLIVVDRPASPCPANYGHALHCIGKPFDLGAFWQICDVVSAIMRIKDY